MKSRKSLRSNGISNVFLTLVGVILLIALGFSFNTLFAPRSQQTPQTNEQAQTASQSYLPSPQQPSSTPLANVDQADPTADWQIYRNTSHGYSIKYPSKWVLREMPNVVVSSPDLKVTNGGTVVGGGEIVIFASDNPSDKPLSDVYRNALNSDFHIIERKERMISNLPSLQYEATGAGIDGTMSGAMVVAKSKLYRIEAYYGQQDRDRIVQVLELMLGSIEFSTK